MFEKDDLFIAEKDQEAKVNQSCNKEYGKIISVTPLRVRVQFKDSKTQSYRPSELKEPQDLEKKVNIEFFSEPELVKEQRDFDWLGPILLFSQPVIAENPEIVSLTFKGVYNYLKEKFKNKTRHF